MKNMVIIIILLSSLTSAGVNENTSKTDSLSSCSSGFVSRPSYSLGLILGEPAGIRPKFIANNILNDYELQVYGMYFGSHYNLGLDLNYIV